MRTFIIRIPDKAMADEIEAALAKAGIAILQDEGCVIIHRAVRVPQHLRSLDEDNIVYTNYPPTRRLRTDAGESGD